MASVTRRPGYDWQVRWKVGERYKSKSFVKKKDADDYRRQVEAELAEDRKGNGLVELNVRQVAEQFIRYQEDRHNDGRIGRPRFEALKSAVDLYIVPTFGDRLINTIKAPEIVDFYSGMCRGGRLSPFTAKLRVKDFGTMYDFARRRGAVSKDVMRDALLELRGITHKPIRTFSLDEVRRLLDTASILPKGRQKRPHLYIRCFVCLAAYSGLRLGEINALSLADIDLVNNIVHVRHSLTNHDVLKSPKTESGKREVPIPQPLADLLREWLANFYVSNPRKLVFRGRDGQYLCRTSFYDGLWHCLLRRAGLFDQKNRLRFHALRHFASSWMIQNGLALPDVANMLGHKKFDITLQTYAHPIMPVSHRSAAMDRMAERLNVLMLPAPKPDCAPIAQG